MYQLQFIEVQVLEEVLPVIEQQDHLQYLLLDRLQLLVQLGLHLAPLLGTLPLINQLLQLDLELEYPVDYDYQVGYRLALFLAYLDRLAEVDGVALLLAAELVELQQD